jgi:DNA repair protein RadC
VGTLSSASVSPRDVFPFARSDHAAAAIVFHNHPPATYPRRLRISRFTAKLVTIGQALWVDVLDHLIVTSRTFVSVKQRSLM